MAGNTLKHPLLCPAAQEIHPVLSHNDEDVSCGISGRNRPSEGSPCCGEYTRCRIWRTVKEAEWANASQKAQKELRSDPRPHVLTGKHERDVLRA